MSNEEKIDQAKSAVKEAFGKVTGDKKVEAEGAVEKHCPAICVCY